MLFSCKHTELNAINLVQEIVKNHANAEMQNTLKHHLSVLNK